MVDGIILDEISLKIVRILSKDSSLPFVEIAKQIGISDATVHMRIKHLLTAGIIDKFTISTNNNRLSYSHVAFVGVNVEPGRVQEVVNYLSGIEEILEMHEMLSTLDLLLKLRARNLKQMRDIVVNNVRKCPRIVKVEFMAMLKTTNEEQTIFLNFLAKE
ncbi:MAG: Lrp/AsnC family transcriptional regulator [Thermoproteota archaeon]|nr:Lrp/AsnC family transcriptional regulator [Thermoproteota archaeon]